MKRVLSIALMLPGIGLSQIEAVPPLLEIEQQIRAARDHPIQRRVLDLHLDMLARAAAEAGNAALFDKLGRLASLLATPASFSHPLESQRATQAMQVPADAARCRGAIPIAAEESLQLQPQNLRVNATTWLRFVAPQAGMYTVSTLGSEGDSKLELWQSCAQRPGELLDQNDDYYGLQAALPIHAERPGQTFLIRVDNDRVDARQSVAVLGGGYLIRGTVTLAEPGGFMRISASTLAVQLLGESGVNQTTGDYTLLVVGEEDVVLRTLSVSGTALEHVMQAHPDRPCLNPQSSTSIGFCGDLAQMTLFEPGPLSYEDIDFDLPLGGSIAGTIVSEASGLPLTGLAAASVEGLGIVHATNLDLQGRYRLQGLPAGSYAVEAAADGHAREMFDNVPCEGDVCDPSLATLVPVVLDATSLVNFALEDIRRLTVEISGAPNSDNSLFLHLLNESGSLQQVYIDQPDSNGNAHFSIDQPSGPFRLYVTGFSIASQVYPDFHCGSETCEAEQTSGSLLNMPVAGQLALKMQVFPRPVIRGRVMSSFDGFPLPGVVIIAYRAGMTTVVANRATSSTGHFQLDRIHPGQYHIFARSFDHLDEFYPDFPCQDDSQSPVLACSDAPRLSVGLQNLDNIDLELDRGGVFAGRISAQHGGSAGGGLVVHTLNADGGFGRAASPAADGTYRVIDLVPDTYRVGVRGNSIFPMIHEGVLCERPPPLAPPFDNCSGGTNFPVSVGEEIENVDFVVVGSTSRLVRVTRLDTNEPVEGAAIDYWNIDGDWLGAVLTDDSGLARVDYFSQSLDLLLSTSNGLGLIDEVYNNIPCPEGAAFFGLCSLADATSVPSWPPSPTTPVLQIILTPEGSDLLWVSGFED